MKKPQKKYKKVTWKTVFEEKEKHVQPLNLNIDLKRITQLFGRSLYIKYFIKNVEPQLLRRHSQQMDRPVVNKGDDELYGNADDDQNEGPYDEGMVGDHVGFEDG